MRTNFDGVPFGLRVRALQSARHRMQFTGVVDAATLKVTVAALPEGPPR